MSVVALYVDQGGPYPPLVPQWYDKERDARTYPGPHPVIAHPPCGPWGRLASLCTQQDPELAPLAVDQVRQFGGVLEHPAGSKLWRHCGLPAPFKTVPSLTGREWSLEVAQVRFGHPCLKLTWLFFVDVSPHALAPIPPWREPTHVIDDNRRGGAALAGVRHLPKARRHLTPPALAEWLLWALRAPKRPLGEWVAQAGPAVGRSPGTVTDPGRAALLRRGRNSG